MTEIVTLFLFFISGASYGITQGILFHYKEYEKYNLNPLFWNPAISWKNKYKIGSTTEPAFWGSTTFLAWTTDAYHLFSTISRFILILSFVFFPACGFTPIEGILSFIALYGSWIVGFHTTYR